MSEHTEQAVVIEWARLMGLEWFYANINGAKLPYTRKANGKRSCRQAGILKAEGMTAGVFDLTLPMARGGFHGLFIEMKDGDNKPTPDQLRFKAFVLAEGYQAVVCWGAGQAVKAIKDYLGAEAVTWPDL